MMCIIIVILLLFTNQVKIRAMNTYTKMYAITTVNIRSKPTTDSKSVGMKYWNEPIYIIERVKQKWYKIHYKGKERYVTSKYVRKKRIKYRRYNSPSNNSFKSCLPSSCITNSTKLAQGRLKSKYRLDYKTGVYMVGDRYCVALGSYYTKYKIGIKVDLVLSHKGRKHILKCIVADQKADKDTINGHKIHTDGSVAEFVVNSSVMPHHARYIHGDVSYAGKQFQGKIAEIRVYK